MERWVRALAALAAAILLAGASFAQPPGQSVPQRVEVSEADLERFADIFVALQQKADEYEAQMLRAQTEDQAREIQARMQRESIAAVEMHGWTAEQYIAVAQAINADPALADRTRRLIDTRQ